MTIAKHPVKKYATRISRHLKSELKATIHEMIVKEKKYLVPGYTAVRLAEDIGSDARYISAVIHSEYNSNFAGYVNRYRIREAVKLIRRKRHTPLSMEQIGGMVGYANRQSFYVAFKAIMGMTPIEYRKEVTK